jgi:hypothetical protein
MCATSVAIIVLLVVVVIYYFTRWLARGRRDGFTSRRAQEVYQSTRELFDRTGGAATYSEYKTTLSDADPVLYTDVRRLWKEGRLSPEEVAKVI